MGDGVAVGVDVGARVGVGVLVAVGVGVLVALVTTQAVVQVRSVDAQAVTLGQFVQKAEQGYRVWPSGDRHHQRSAWKPLQPGGLEGFFYAVKQ